MKFQSTRRMTNIERHWWKSWSHARNPKQAAAQQSNENRSVKNKTRKCWRELRRQGFGAWRWCWTPWVLTDCIDDVPDDELSVWEHVGLRSYHFSGGKIKGYAVQTTPTLDGQMKEFVCDWGRRAIRLERCVQHHEPVNDMKSAIIRYSRHMWAVIKLHNHEIRYGPDCIRYVFVCRSLLLFIISSGSSVTQTGEAELKYKYLEMRQHLTCRCRALASFTASSNADLTSNTWVRVGQRTWTLHIDATNACSAKGQTWFLVRSAIVRFRKMRLAWSSGSLILLLSHVRAWRYFFFAVHTRRRASWVWAPTRLLGQADKIKHCRATWCAHYICAGNCDV